MELLIPVEIVYLNSQSLSQMMEGTRDVCRKEVIDNEWKRENKIDFFYRAQNLR